MRFSLPAPFPNTIVLVLKTKSPRQPVGLFISIKYCFKELSGYFLIIKPVALSSWSETAFYVTMKQRRFMEFVRLKYANNKLINANLKEHREIIEEYILKKNMEYFGFVPVLFGPSGKMLEIDLIFKKPKDEKTETTQKNTK